MLIFNAFCSQEQLKVNNQTVAAFDLNRYLGTWYEIARFPHFFEKDLVAVTATYTMREDGKISVLNQGYYQDFTGKLKQAQGVAKIGDKSIPGFLRVSFFLFFYSDYRVMELDQEHYQWALVGSSDENYLWILARKPKLDENTYQELVLKAKNRGYDISKLFLVPHK